MAGPQTRDELIDYALRTLGYPVITINVDREQCEDRMDEALEFFAEYHFDGAEKAFFRYPITAEDISNKRLRSGTCCWSRPDSVRDVDAGLARFSAWRLSL